MVGGQRRRGMLANKDKKANKKKTKDKYLCAFFLVYMVALFRITVFRSNFSLFHVMENGTINLSLFQDYIPLIRQERWFLDVYKRQRCGGSVYRNSNTDHVRGCLCHRKGKQAL